MRKLEREREFTAPSGRSLKLRVVSVGTNFGIVGQVISRNGRVLAETKTYPTGAMEMAFSKAAALAERL